MAFSASSRSCRARPLRSVFPATLLFNVCAPGGLCTRFAAAAEFGLGDDFLKFGGDDDAPVTELMPMDLDLGSKDDLHHSSLFESSSTPVPTMRRTGALGNHSIGNNNDAVLSAKPASALPEDSTLSNQEPWTAPARVDDTLVDNAAVNNRKGFLGSIYTLGQNMFVFCGTLALWSLAYPLSANAKQSYNNPFMQFIIIGNVILLFLSFILAFLASHLKENDSINCAQLYIFKWLFLPVSIALCAGFCIMLHFCANTSIWVLWPLGIIGSAVILLGWIWIFYIEQPKILEESNRGHAC